MTQTKLYEYLKTMLCICRENKKTSQYDGQRDNVQCLQTDAEV